MKFNIFKKLKFWLLVLMLLPIISTYFSSAKADLMEDIMNPAKQYWTTIDIWTSTRRVWKKIFEGWVEIDIDNKVEIRNSPSIIVKITRLLLSLVVALSVTMILYNGLTYIIQTWQWKEWKDLVKNLVYIVVWILVALFSVTIITVLQSISTTLDQETTANRRDDTDEHIIEWDKKWLSWKTIKEMLNK